MTATLMTVTEDFRDLSAQSSRSGLRRGRTEQALVELKERLLRSAQQDARDVDQERLMCLAAGEAEALAWLTPYPLLVLPVLLEEKIHAAKRYYALQACLHEAGTCVPHEQADQTLERSWSAAAIASQSRSRQYLRYRTASRLSGAAS